MDDDETHVIVVEGAGKGFCGGFDLTEYGSSTADHPCQQERHPWDPMEDVKHMGRCRDAFMSLFSCCKPTIAKVHGSALGGGSDIALSCDILVMSEDAKVGYPPTRVWGCPITAHWAFRLGPARAKAVMFTGDMISGKKAAEWGLAHSAVPAAELEAAVHALASRIASVPKSHLAMHKAVVNSVVERAGLAATQQLATVFDGITRHNPEGLWFRRLAQAEGFKAAVEWRDSGRPIPEGDGARAAIAELEEKIRVIKARL